MRPTRLELKGFSTFRETTELDFSDTELFALVGATGAGKSSVIDGIVFALYGSVVRYRSTNLVAPVINQLSNEARVRLDFDLAGQSYTAVRVVRRTASGASTKEARLFHGENVLAGTAPELTETVEDLLGLDFEQFTKTVVLPQGEFARFLNEKPEARQGLLRRLLGMELYRDMGSTARGRARDFETTRVALEEQLGDRTVITDAMVDEQRSVISALTALESMLVTETESLKAVDDHLAEALAALDAVTANAKRLSTVEMPDVAQKLADRLASAQRDRDEATGKADAASDTLAETKTALDEHPTAAELERVVDQHSERKELRKELARLAKQKPGAERAVERCTKTLHADEASVADAYTRVADLRILAGLGGLADSLAVGEDCPLCGQVVDVVPDHDPSAELNQAIEAATDAGAKRDISRTELREAERELDRLNLEVETIGQRVEQLDVDLGNARNETSAKAELREVTQLTISLERAQSSAESAAELVGDIDARLALLEDEGSHLRRALTEQRDELISLDPPTPTEQSITNDWAAFVKWASAALPKIQQEQTELEERVEIAKATSQQARQRMAALISEHMAEGRQSIDTRAMVGDPLREIANALGAANSTLDALLTEQATQAKTIEKIEILQRDGSVAAELGKLLNASNFEQWLMSDVMETLASRATERLLELSGGAYSLVTRDTDFAIRDHRNADEVRRATTLSGGETFLASLALALSLSESVADLATEGAPQIEAMFLDEGFGTLDPDTLDTVAAAIEELGAAGRMIGIVTHVSDLAERIPTRFVVSKNTNGSFVERVHD